MFYRIMTHFNIVWHSKETKNYLCSKIFKNVFSYIVDTSNSYKLWFEICNTLLLSEATYKEKRTNPHEDFLFKAFCLKLQP